LERADRIGGFWGHPESRAFAELLIDCEEDRTLRAVLVGMLRETDRQVLPPGGFGGMADVMWSDENPHFALHRRRTGS
jgi:hypothetical protein